MTKFLSFLCVFFLLNTAFSQTICKRQVTNFDYSTTTGYSIQGTAELIDSLGNLYLVFSSDFSTSSGPDLFVYLTETGAAPTAFGNDDIEIAPLISNTGSQTYILPSTVTINSYDYVTIHCKQFNHLWNSGLLSPETCFTYPSYSNISEEECFSYTSPSGTSIWTTSGEYSDTLVGANSYGGDSIITVDLTINTVDVNVSQTTLSTELTATASNSTFQWINCSDNSPIMGETNSTFTPTESGDYAVMVTSSTMCESISSCFSFYKVKECLSYTSPSGNKEWITSGIFADTLVGMNVDGSDSIFTIDLTINNVDISVSQSSTNNQLTAEADNSSFQWINCSDNSLITGEISSVFEPSESGSYAVIVTSINNCIDTSMCFNINTIGIDEDEILDYSVYPNPSNEVVFINTQQIDVNSILISDLLNKTVQYSLVSSNTNQVSLTIDAPLGIYFIQFKNLLGDNKIVKIIKN